MNQVISNKVYEEIQPYTSVQTATGKVLYANSFAGIPSVSMPSEIQSLLDSDVGLNGTNLLVQLQQKFQFFRNGPWYVDSRDGVIYIHNRKFQEEPVHTYVYQNENGEVLKVQFSTNYIQRSQKVQLWETITPEDKGIQVTQTTVLDKEKLLEQKQYDVLNDNTYYNPPVIGNNIENYQDHPSESTGAFQQWMDANEKYKQRMQEREAVRKKLAQDPKYDLNQKATEKIKSMNAQASQQAINEFINQPGIPDYLKRQLKAWEAEVKNSRDPKALNAALEKILHGVYYTFDEPMEYEYEEWVDPADYDQFGWGPVGMGGPVDPASKATNQKINGYKKLDEDPHIEITGVEYNQEDIVANEKIYAANSVPMRVKIIHKKKSKVRVPLYSLYQNLMGRYGGAERYYWAANANANGGLKRKEKVVKCYMTVVGRPMLESSMVINIQNVGQRWSGLWYVKKCTHRMDVGMGYLCDLELVNNNAKDGASTHMSSMQSEDVLHVYTDANGKTVYGKKPESTTKDKYEDDFTRDEVLFAGQKYMRGLGGGYQGPMTCMTNFEAEGLQEFTAKKQAFNEKYSEDPVTKAGGIVRAETIKVDGKGKLQIEGYHEMSTEELGVSDSAVNSKIQQLGDPVEFAKIKIEAAKATKRSGLLKALKEGTISKMDYLKSIPNNN